MKKQNLLLINNDTYQRETFSERPSRQPLNMLKWKRKKDKKKKTDCVYGIIYYAVN